MTKKPYILIVDDDPVNIDILMESLDYMEIHIDSANHGLEAWEKLQANPTLYETILLDRMMPIMDGMELLRKIKQDEMLSRIPVIMQTAAALSSQIAEGMQAGAFYYLIKPFESRLVTSIVQSALGDFKKQSQLRNEINTANQVGKFLQEGHFSIKYAQEARQLAVILANAFPDPKKTIIGLSELLLNAVEHGNLAISYEEKTLLLHENRWDEEIDRRIHLPEFMHKLVHIYFKKTVQSIEITIQDQGKGFDWQNYLEFSPHRAFDNHGRGIAMAKMLSFDSIEYQGNGNRVTLRSHIPQ